MDIEAVAHDTPEKVINFDIDPTTGFMPHHDRTILKAFDLKGYLAKQAGKHAEILYEGNAYRGSSRQRNKRVALMS